MPEKDKMPDSDDKELELVLEGKSLNEAKAIAKNKQPKIGRLGTKKFCRAWMQAGERTTNWEDFVKKFREYAGDEYYPEHLIKARIAKYEAQMAPFRGVHPPKYPKERTPVAVMFFKAPESEREVLPPGHASSTSG